MRFAINYSLNLIVDANQYRSSRFSNERLYCPYCRERVTFYPESIDGKSAHFRHYHGTYREDCENYVCGYGTYGQRVNGNSVKSEDIFFEKRGNRYLFSLRVVFSKEELDRYESNSSIMHFKVLHREVSTEFHQAIDRRFFVEGQKAYIELKSVGESIIRVLDGEPKRFEFIKGITFFKMLADGEWSDNSFIAKKIFKTGDNRLYVNEKYILIVPKYSVISNSFRVVRIERSVSSVVDIYFVEIVDKSPSVIEFCQKSGYELCDAKEKFEILWPPCVQTDDELIMDSDDVYVHSNFYLIYGNTINTTSVDRLNGYSKVHIKSEIIIDTGNIHAVLAVGDKDLNNYIDLNPEIIKLKGYKIESANDCIFSSVGIARVDKNITVKLNRQREVRTYTSTYLTKKIIYPFYEKEYNNILLDVVQYGKSMKRFVASEIHYCGNNPYVWEYLVSCRRNKKISEGALKLINEVTND